MIAVANNTRICVGRDSELAQIDVQMGNALAGEASVCIVQGTNGSGKSTLMREYVSSLESNDNNLVVAWGHCDQQTGSVRPLLPWIEILQSVAGTSDIIVPAEQIQDIGGVLGSVRSALSELAPDIVELLIPGIGLVIRSASLITRKTPLANRLRTKKEQREKANIVADRAELQNQYIAILEKILDDSPLLLVFDDLHCADDASLDLLRRLADKTSDKQLMLLIATSDSSDAIQQTINEVSEKTNSLTVDLDQARIDTGKDLASAYVDAITPGVSQHFVDELIVHTGGHPLFIVELMDHLIDNGKLIRAGDDWQEERDISWADLPRSVETVLSTQLSSLDETLLSIFQAAAIEGDQFTVEVIAGVLDMSPMNTAKILARRAPANLVETVGTYHIDGSRVTKYRFCYSLARRFVYNQIDDVERIYLHEAVAKQIQSLAGDNGESLAAQIAYHFEHAEVYDRAAFYHEQAAIYAKTTCSLVESDKHFRKALKFSGEDQEKLRITWSLAKNSSQIGSIDEALDLIIAARVMAEDRSDEDLLSILSYESLYLFLLNRLDESEDLTLKTLALAKDDGNEQVQAILWDTLGRIHGMRGQLDEAVTAAEHAVELAEKQPDIATIARCYAGLGWNLKQVGRYSDALSVLEDNLSLIAREDLDLSIASDTHNSIADCYISLEDYAPAREHLEIAIENWKNFDQVASASIALNNLANLANREALYTEALTFAEEALIMDRKNFGEQHPGVAFPLCCIGESYLGLTRFSDAVAVLQQALEIRLNNEVSEGALAWTKWLLGRALVESGEGINQGIEHVKEARSVLESMGVAAESELGDIDRWMSEMKPGAI